MATKPFTALTSPNPLGNSRVITWAALANGDDGVPWEGADFADRYAFVTNGTFGAAGSIQYEGSNDGVSWVILKNPQGTTIVKTAFGGEAVQENPRFVRPKVTAGDGTTALTAILYERRNR
jgi:hypothetical protein